MAFGQKRGLPRSTSGTRTAANIMQAGRGPTDEYRVALGRLEPDEFVALVTSAGLMKNDEVVCPMGRVFLTNRRVLYMFDGSIHSLSMDLLNSTVRIQKPRGFANHLIIFNETYGVVLPKQESATFLALTEQFAREFERPANWYSDPWSAAPGDHKQLRYWDGSHWTEHIHSAAEPDEDDDETRIQAASEAIQGLGYASSREMLEVVVNAQSRIGTIWRPTLESRATDIFPALIGDDTDWFYICRTDNLLADRLPLVDLSSCSLRSEEGFRVHFNVRSGESIEFLILGGPTKIGPIRDTVNRLAEVANRNFEQLGLRPEDQD